MTRLRRDTQDSVASSLHHPLRVIASGTLFVTHTLSLPSHPEPSSVVRASSVTRSRGGSASTCLSILAQFPSVEATLVAPLGGNDDGQRIIHDLEKERVSTRFCKVWEEAGVPTAWVLHADDTNTHTVINNNPLPDITHEDFISLLGPLLAPENYAHLAPGSSSHGHGPKPTSASASAAANNSNTLQSPTVHGGPMPVWTGNSGNSPAPFDWIHFEGRSVKTTLGNMMGLDGLARERKWRSHCVFSVDVGRRARQGVEALIPYADVLFLNKHHAHAHSPQYAASPRAFLLSLTTLVAPHALLVAHWGEDGAALLSMPTREYFQSSGWVGIDPQSLIPEVPGPNTYISSVLEDKDAELPDEVLSVRTGSDFWAGQHTDSSSMFTTGSLSPMSNTARSSPIPPTAAVRPRKMSAMHARNRAGRQQDGNSSDSDYTQLAPGPAGRDHQGQRADAVTRSLAYADTSRTTGIIDEVGAQDAFVAGMMFALSRRLLPGDPYTPASGGRVDISGADNDRERGRWRLEECLKFATELAGRKGRKMGWVGLAEEMAHAGWFESV